VASIYFWLRLAGGAHNLTRELPGWIVPGVDWSADLFSDDIDAINDGKLLEHPCRFKALAIVFNRVLGE